MLNVESNRIEITDTISILKDEIKWDFKRTSKPGGSAVNSQAVGAELRYDLSGETSLPNKVLERLREVAANKINSNNVLVIYSEEFRTQQENREASIDKLRELIEEAATPVTERIPTRPPRDVKEESLNEKKIHGRKKELRKPIPPEEIDNLTDTL